jgi:hypothetical protein
LSAAGWLALILAGPAGAQTYTGGVPPLAGSSDPGAVVVAPAVAAQGAESRSGNAPVRLALTGGDIFGLVAMGVVLVTLGTLAVRAGRRPLPD